MFYVALKDYVFWNLSFYFYLHIQRRLYLYTHLEKRFYVMFLYSYEIFSCLDPLAWVMNLFAGGMVFNKFENILRWWASFNFENLTPKFLQILI